MSEAIIPHRAAWREVDGFLGRKGIAFDLAAPNDVEATLYVVRIKGSPTAPDILPGLPTAPRPRPASSGGLPSEAWQEGGLLYVLVVAGTPQDYRHFVKPHDVLLTQPVPPPKFRTTVATVAKRRSRSITTA